MQYCSLLPPRRPAPLMSGRSLEPDSFTSSSKERGSQVRATGGTDHWTCPSNKHALSPVLSQLLASVFHKANLKSQPGCCVGVGTAESVRQPTQVCVPDSAPANTPAHGKPVSVSSATHKAIQFHSTLTGSHHSVQQLG